MFSTRCKIYDETPSPIYFRNFTPLSKSRNVPSCFFFKVDLKKIQVIHGIINKFLNKYFLKGLSFFLISILIYWISDINSVIEKKTKLSYITSQFHRGKIHKIRTNSWLKIANRQDVKKAH